MKRKKKSGYNKSFTDIIQLRDEVLFDRVVEKHKKFEVYIARSSVVSQVQHGIHATFRECCEQENEEKIFLSEFSAFCSLSADMRCLGLKANR